MTERKLTGAQKIYGQIHGDAKYRSIHWISNVLFTSCGKPCKRLTALKRLVDLGLQVSPIPFIMPYDGLILNGKAVEAMPLLDACQIIPYKEKK